MDTLRHCLRRLELRPVDGGDATVAAAPAISLRVLLRRFWPDARPYRRWLAPALLLVALGPAIDTATIGLYGRLVDQVLVPRNLAPFGGIALAYLALTVLDGLVTFGDSYLAAWVGERFLLEQRTRLFAHLQDLPLGVLARQRLGDVVARLTGDVAEIERLLLSGITDGAAHLLRIVFFTAALFWVSWRLALLALVAAPLFWLASRVLAGRVKRAARHQRQRGGSIGAVAEESLANAALVQAYNRQETEVARFRREAAGSLSAQLDLARSGALFTPVLNLIQLGGVLTVVAAGTWETSHGNLTLGGLLAFAAYLNQLYGPVRGLSHLATDVAASAAGAERIVELLDQPKAIETPAGAMPLGRARGELAFESVTFRFPGAEGDALRDVSFRVGPGEMLALVGASGAGKSTVVNLLLRFADPGTGRVLLDNHDLRDLDLRSLREQTAVVLQSSLVLSGTIRDNIAFGRPGASEAEIVRAARAADADGFIRALPDGYDTEVGPHGAPLSGGQRQRLALARALVRDAPVLILDEPTTGLDAASGERVVEALRRSRHGRTTILVSHDLRAVREATTIVVLDKGRVVEQGTHFDLLRQDGAYSRLCRFRLTDADEGQHRALATVQADRL